MQLIFRVINKERVGSGDGEDVICGMPGSVEYFVAKVQHIHRNLVFLVFVGVADNAERFQ